MYKGGGREEGEKERNAHPEPCYPNSPGNQGRTPEDISVQKSSLGRSSLESADSKAAIINKSAFAPSFPCTCIFLLTKSSTEAAMAVGRVMVTSSMTLLASWCT
jgi:hypothetical protein